MKTSFILTLFVTLGFYATPIESIADEDNSHNLFQLHLLQSAWDEILANHPEDLNRTITIYQQVNNLISLNIERMKAFEVQQEIRSYLLRKTVKILTKKLSLDHDTQAILKFHTFLINNYEEAMLKNIYTKTIDELFDFKDTHVLAAQIRNIYHQDNHSQKAYEIMLQMQLHLLKKLLNNDDVNDFSLLNVAYYLYASKNNAYYNQMDMKEKINFESVINRLPTTLKYLFFETEFCLSNDRDQYLYTAYTDLNIDNTHRFIFLWYKPDTIGTQGAFIGNFTEETSNIFGDLSLKVSLQSVQFDMFVCLESAVGKYKDIVTGWTPGNAPEGSIWSLTFVDGKIVFQQNDKLLCSSDEYYDRTSERIFVHGYADDEHTPQTSACQWEAGFCPL